jgi:hypothetical protein
MAVSTVVLRSVITHFGHLAQLGGLRPRNGLQQTVKFGFIFVPLLSTLHKSLQNRLFLLRNIPHRSLPSA